MLAALRADSSIVVHKRNPDYATALMNKLRCIKILQVLFIEKKLLVYKFGEYS